MREKLKHGIIINIHWTNHNLALEHVLVTFCFIIYNWSWGQHFNNNFWICYNTHSQFWDTFEVSNCHKLIIFNKHNKKWTCDFFFFFLTWKYISNVVSSYLFKCHLFLQTHDIYKHFRKHTWHFCHNYSNFFTSCKQPCYMQTFFKNLWVIQSLTRFDIWNLISKIWDSSPQKNYLTLNLEKFFFANSHTSHFVWEGISPLSIHIMSQA